MKRLLTLLALCSVALACGGGEDVPGEAPPTNSTAAAAAEPAEEIDAKRIWKVRCIACHGLYGDMGTNGAANLQESVQPLDYRINIIKNGSENGVMTAFGEILSEAEIEAMAKYTMAFNKDL